MNKEQKINYIKYWLQRFGERGKNTFTVEVKVGQIDWVISLQYNFDSEDNQLKPNDWCFKTFKHVHNNSISDRTEDELDQIINQLKLNQML